MGRRLGECERRAFASVEEGALVPGGQVHQTQLAFSAGASAGVVQVDAVETAVDLGDTQLDQLAQAFVEADSLLEAEHGR